MRRGRYLLDSLIQYVRETDAPIKLLGLEISNKSLVSLLSIIISVGGTSVSIYIRSRSSDQ